MIQKTHLKSAEVSVIIPCYSCSDTLARAVASVANQTMLPKEVILIDDASPDNGETLKVIDAVIKDYSAVFNIKVIKFNENKGAASARNAGWNAATEPYIALLDADDAWHPQKLEIQYKFMLSNSDVTLCGHGMQVVKYLSLPNWKTSDFTHRIINKNRLLLSNPFVTPSIMFKTEITLRFNESKRYMEDFLLLIEMAFNNYKVVNINVDLVAIYKPMFGGSGLSANLWAMEKSELNNYWLLYQKNYIHLIYLVFLWPYSYIKYIRRVMIVKLMVLNFGS